MSSYMQLPLTGPSMGSVEPPPDPGVDHGEVFTRPWVVALILDLVGYTPDADLGSRVLVEPSCGTGAFLLPIVDRLIESCARHGRSLEDEEGAIQAYDLLEANAERSRKAIVDRLVEAGLIHDSARKLAEAWVTTGDFLLHPHASAGADFVVGNPPYVRLESVPRSRMDAYRRACPTMRGRSDIYVGFIERGLDLLRPDGALAYICADRWMHNQYGCDLRAMITGAFAVETVIAMHDVDAFEEDVSAYPAITVLRNRPQTTTAMVKAGRAFGPADGRDLTRWVSRRSGTDRTTPSYEASRLDHWFEGRDLWPSGRPTQLALIAELESRFAPLQDTRTGTRVGIGVATGCDDVFIVDEPGQLEEDRLLPLLHAADVAHGSVSWSGRYLVNPWNEDGLVDISRFPQVYAYFKAHETQLRRRHIAVQRPTQWFRTIDRIDHKLLSQTRLVLPDMKAFAHPVLDDGHHYPHHNLYYVVSQAWDPEVLGGLLLSDVANLFVGAYCVKMRGGCYRFQAQYLRQIRVPEVSAITQSASRELQRAFAERDRDRATATAARLYDIDLARLR
jgi:adenine-specific DNA-methyltransferase